jgi:hypothetical protein
MQDLEQSGYFERRAEEEKAAAAGAADERAARTHRELAERYMRQAKGEAEATQEDEEPNNGGTLSSDFKILP